MIIRVVPEAEATSAKISMTIQSLMSLAILSLVITRAVNIFT